MLTERIRKAATTDTEKPLGPEKEVGNKPALSEVEGGGSLSSRLRAILNA